MAQNDVGVLKFSLLVAAIVLLVDGISYFLLPSMLVTLSGEDPINFGWVRWAGGVLIALGICTFMVYSKPEKQGIFVLSIALGYLLAGLGLLYSLIMHEYSGVIWFLAMHTCLILVISVLLFWGRSKAKGIL
jgi:hypothetical protein